MDYVATPKAITISRSKDYHSLAIRDIPIAIPTPHELVLKIAAAALNHRDVYIPKNLHPAISFNRTLLDDGCGLTFAHPNSGAASGSPAVSQRVIVNPGTR